jgi:general secretion pathway protein G
MQKSSERHDIVLPVLLAGVLGLLMWHLAAPMYYVGHGHSNRINQDFSTLQPALNLFRMNAGRFPTKKEGLAALVERPSTPSIGSWEQTLKREQLDPWQNPYRYEYPPRRQKEDPDIFSAGPDIIFDTEDDIGNWDRD